MIIFFHGLNTYGDDLLHIGPMTFGLMHSRVERAFLEREIDFIGVTQLGFGHPRDQAERALAFLDELGIIDSDTPLDFLGQSMGGLVARALAANPKLKTRVRRIMTIGTPHKGTNTAQFGLEFSQTYPRLCSIVAKFGYDTRAKADIFKHYTPEAVAEFNLQFPESPLIPEISLLCQVEWQDLSLPLRPLYKRIHECDPKGMWTLSDGFISSESQMRGEVIGPFALDHFGELGAFFQASPSARRRADIEFNRMINTIQSIVSK